MVLSLIIWATASFAANDVIYPALAGRDPETDPNCDGMLLEDYFANIGACASGERVEGNPMCEFQPNEQQQSDINAAIDALDRAVKRDPELNELSQQMYNDVEPGLKAGGPPVPPNHYQEPCYGDYDTFISWMRVVTMSAPVFIVGHNVGVPMRAIMGCFMSTKAGQTFFRDSRVNTGLGAVLNTWTEFLNAPESRKILHTGIWGWRSQCVTYNFVDMDLFAHDPKDEYWGFDSWNSFFDRTLEGQGPAPYYWLPEETRPIASPDDDNVMVFFGDTNAYATNKNLSADDVIMTIKGPTNAYTLEGIFAGHPVWREFVGGAAYQGFFSALMYHRYHFPVGGTILHAWNEPGLFYPAFNHINPDGMGPSHPLNMFAGWAARAIVVMENENLGLIALVPIGMESISSCQLYDTVTPGAKVKKGQGLGLFAFGGSTLVMFMQKDTAARVQEWVADDSQHLVGAEMFRLNPLQCTNSVTGEPCSKEGRKLLFGPSLAGECLCK